MAVARFTDNEQLVQIAKAFIKAAPAARPDLSKERKNLKGPHGAYHQKILPLNTQAFTVFKEEHIGKVKSDNIRDNALIALSTVIAEDAFYGDESTVAQRSFGSEIDEVIFQAVADLAAVDGFGKEVKMAEDFVAGAKETVVQYGATQYRSPAGGSQVPTAQMPEVIAAIEGLKGSYLKGKFLDSLKANPLTALEDAAMKVAQHRLQIKPMERLTAAMS